MTPFTTCWRLARDLYVLIVPKIVISTISHSLFSCQHALAHCPQYLWYNKYFLFLLQTLQLHALTFVVVDLLLLWFRSTFDFAFWLFFSLNSLKMEQFKNYDLSYIFKKNAA